MICVQYTMKKQELDLPFSTKITLFSLFWAIVIVCYHLNPTFDYQHIIHPGTIIDHVSYYLNAMINSLGNTAVSFFFLSSGYLLYRNLSSKNFSEKLNRRIYTLLIPLVLWNVIGLMHLLVFGGGTEDGFWVILLKIATSQYDGPLWFVLQLMILFLLSPFLKWCFQKSILGLILLGILFFVPLITNSIWSNWLSRSIGYLPIYLTGAYLGLHVDRVIQQEHFRTPWLLVLSLLLLILSLFESDHMALQFLKQFQILFIWILIPKKQVRLNWCHEIAFFIYAIHCFVIGIFMRLLHRFIIDETIEVSTTYVLLSRLLFTAASILLIYFAAWSLIRWFPKIYNVLTGSRMPEQIPLK